MTNGMFAQGATSTSDTLGLSDDAKLFLDAFNAEEIVYYPLSGGSRVIKAVIFRMPAQPITGSPGGVGKHIEVYVANAGTSTTDDEYGGIDASVIDLGGDNLELAVRIGETPVQRRITDMNLEDEGMLKLTIT